MNIILMLNGIAVGVFGMILSASFCDIVWSQKKRLLFTGSMAVLLLIQGNVYYFMETGVVRYLYPVITHVPLVLILFCFTKEFLWVIISVLTAYLCCQIRRWLALLAVAVFGCSTMTQEIAELLITVPLLVLLLKYISPAVRMISNNTMKVQSNFGMIPAVYYIFDYGTLIYADLFVKGSPVVAEFMSFVCSIAYLIFLLHFSEEKWMRNQLEQVKDSLNLQVYQAVREIEMLRQSQEKMREYRHDLRHHMQYISSCIETGRLESAQDYIQEICKKIDKSRVSIFCENEAANLIFSAFMGRAKEQNISMSVKAQISPKLHIEESDLCVLLSNALENALYACNKLEGKVMETFIEVSAFEKHEKLFLQITNSCASDSITFIQGIPVNKQPGHGIGVRSICALVEQYGGIYSFEVENNKFILRVSL